MAEQRPRSPRRAWSPRPLASAPVDTSSVLEAEIEAIVGLLRERGPLSRAVIRQELETRFWGPGRLSGALYEARRRGRIRRVRRRVYEAV